MPQDEFRKKHSIAIHCPACGAKVSITEWTTTIRCSCGHSLDTIEIMTLTSVAEVKSLSQTTRQAYA